MPRLVLDRDAVADAQRLGDRQHHAGDQVRERLTGGEADDRRDQRARGEHGRRRGGSSPPNCDSASSRPITHDRERDEAAQEAQARVEHRRQLVAHDRGRECVAAVQQRAVDDDREHDRADDGEQRGQLVLVLVQERGGERGNIEPSMERERTDSRGSLPARASGGSRACAAGGRRRRLARGVGRAVDLAAGRVGGRACSACCGSAARAGTQQFDPRRPDDAVLAVRRPARRAGRALGLRLVPRRSPQRRLRRRARRTRRRPSIPLYPLLMRGLGWVVGSPLRRRDARLARLLPRSRSRCCTGSPTLELGAARRARDACCSSRSSRPRSSSPPSTRSRCSCSSPSARSWPRAAGAGRGRARSAGSRRSTRNSGVLLLVPLVLLFLYGPRADRRRPPPVRRAAPRAAAPAPPADAAGAVARARAARARRSTSAGAAIALGDALAPFHAQALWLRALRAARRGCRRRARARGSGCASSCTARRRRATSPRAGGDPFAGRGPQPDAARLPRVRARRVRRRAAAAADRVRRLRGASRSR